MLFNSPRYFQETQVSGGSLYGWPAASIPGDDRCVLSIWQYATTQTQLTSYNGGCCSDSVDSFLNAERDATALEGKERNHLMTAMQKSYGRPYTMHYAAFDPDGTTTTTTTTPPSSTPCTADCCGPLFDELNCRTKTTPFCNEINGYCGDSEKHRDAQVSTQYDWREEESATSQPLTTPEDTGPPTKGAGVGAGAVEENTDRGSDAGNTAANGTSGAGAGTSTGNTNGTARTDISGESLAGIIIGIIAFCVVVVLVVLWCCSRRGKRHPKSTEEFLDMNPTIEMQSNPMFNRAVLEGGGTAATSIPSVQLTPNVLYSSAEPSDQADTATPAASEIADENNVYDVGVPRLRAARTLPPSPATDQPRRLILRAGNAVAGPRAEGRGDAGAGATTTAPAIVYATVVDDQYEVAVHQQGNGPAGTAEYSHLAPRNDINGSDGGGSRGGDGNTGRPKMPSNANYSGYDPMQAVSEDNTIVYAVPSEA